MYVDDILIYSKTTEEYIAHVKVVFERLAAKNWHVKENKCALFLPVVEFLSHVVSAAGVMVAVDKVDAVVSWPTPMCVPEVQGFLSLQTSTGGLSKVCHYHQAPHQPDEEGHRVQMRSYRGSFI